MTKPASINRESDMQVSFPVMKVSQPIGDFYVGKMSAKDLIEISWFDIRRLAGSDDLDSYLGIQRTVSDDRVREISRYVQLPDATFPTAVILAVEGRCAAIENLCPDTPDTDFFRLSLKNIPGEFGEDTTVLFRGIARVLDGQHRIKGLKESPINLEKFDVNVCVFVEADISDQASIFATVNLAQTKVNKSLVYDLLSYSKSRSPERSCHTVTVTLDQSDKSPFYRRIKRLGVSTEGRFGEVLTQATVVKAMLPYITSDVMRDRAIGKNGGQWPQSEEFDSSKLIFRNWFIQGNDETIALQMMHYFEAVRRRWPDAWGSVETGNMLPRTNGFRAFMSFLRPALNNSESDDNGFVKMSTFLKLFQRTSLSDGDFNTEKYVPGSSGERSLFRDLMAQTGLDGYS